MSTTADTIWVRRPTAQPAGEVSAPTFRLDRPLAGLTIGLRTDRAWRSWQLIASIWEAYLQRDGAQTLAVETGAQIGQPGVERPQADRGVRGPGRCRDRRARHVRLVHHVHDQGLGHGRSAREAGRRGRVRGVHGARAQRRPARRSRRPAGARAAVPARSAPHRGARADRRDYYPQVLELLGVTA